MKREINPNFHLPTEVYLESEILQKIAGIIPAYGSRITVVITSDDIDIYHQEIEILSSQLRSAHINSLIFDQLPGEPNTEDIDRAVSMIKKLNTDLIIGIGGVNSINAAKALALLSSNYIFCEDIFSNPYLRNKPLPLITIPGYPAFGFEINPYFYLTEIHELTKKVYANRDLYPVATIIDPVLSFRISIDQMVSSTISSLALAAESIISNVNNNITNTFALKAIDLIFRNLPLAYQERENITPRINLMTSSMMSGIAFATSRLSVSLAIALALSSRSQLDILSGISIMIPHIMEFNLTSSPGKYVQMAKVMGEDVRNITVIEAAIKAVEAIRKIETDVELPHRLSYYEINKSDFKEIAEISLRYPFLENAPRPLNTGEIEAILTAAY